MLKVSNCNLQTVNMGRTENTTTTMNSSSYMKHEKLKEYVDPNEEAVGGKKDIQAKSNIFLLLEFINKVHIKRVTTTHGLEKPSKRTRSLRAVKKR